MMICYVLVTHVLLELLHTFIKKVIGVQFTRLNKLLIGIIQHDICIVCICFHYVANFCNAVNITYKTPKVKWMKKKEKSKSE